MEKIDYNIRYSGFPDKTPDVPQRMWDALTKPEQRRLIWGMDIENRSFEIQLWLKNNSKIK